MKKKLFSTLILGICLLNVLLLNPGANNNKHSTAKHQSGDVYVGDTDYGADAAYAVYATSDEVGASIVQVYQYSTKTFFTATGYTYAAHGTGLFSGNLTASNGYYWNGPLLQ